MSPTSSEWISISLEGRNLHCRVSLHGSQSKPSMIQDDLYVLLNDKPSWIHSKLPWIKGGPPWPHVNLHDSSRESPRLQEVLCSLFVSHNGSRWASLKAPCRISMSTQWASTPPEWVSNASVWPMHEGKKSQASATL